MSKQLKERKIEIRMPPGLFRELEKACKIEGRSKTNFCVVHLRPAIEAVIEGAKDLRQRAS